MPALVKRNPPRVPVVRAPASAAPSDQDLLDQACAGDRQAFRKLVDRYRSLVASTVNGMLGAGPEADDVGQEVFIRFYNTLDRFRAEAKVGTYLTRMAINASIDALRRRKRWHKRFLSRDVPDMELNEPAVEGHQTIDQQERIRLVRRAIQHLKPDHRAVVVLRMIDGYSTKETAELLGVPTGTVLSRLSRATDQLETLLKPYIDEG